jgi:hypothetical protein
LYWRTLVPCTRLPTPRINSALLSDTRAHRELETILNRNNSVLVVFPVLCEAHTLVLRRLGGLYAAHWLSELLSGSLPFNPETNDYLDATVGLRKYSDHPITLVDALLARLTRKMEAPVWTFRPPLRNDALQRLEVRYPLIHRRPAGKNDLNRKKRS